MRKTRAFPRLFASGPGGWLLRASIGRRGWVRTILIGRGGDTCSIWAGQKRPSPQPSPGGRGGRPRCLSRCIDLRNRRDYGFGEAGSGRRFSEAFPCQMESIMDSQQEVHVGVIRQYSPIGPLYLWAVRRFGRARVRAGFSSVHRTNCLTASTTGATRSTCPCGHTA